MLKKILLSILFIIILSLSSYALEGENIAGIGVLLCCTNGIIKINFVVDNSPAQHVGLKNDDIILEVNGEKISDLHTASTKIRGPIGTSVKLLIQRNNQTREYNITRGNIFISDYVEISKKVYFYKKYLKYKDGIYYFWTKELYGAWGKNYNNGYKSYFYSKRMYAIDLKNQKCALVKELAYDKDENILYSEDYSDNLSYEIIVPNTSGYLLYAIIDTLDKGDVGKNKENLNGYIIPTK